ncbi:MAG: YdcF family protein [Bacillota bacterium]
MDISMVTILVSFLFIEMLIFIGAYVNHDDSPDYVLILGAGIKNEQPSLELRYRLDQSIAYMNRNPEIKKVILCGGIGKNEIVSEAAVMETYLLEHGINSNKIIKENESTSTYENIKNSKEIIQIIDQGEKIKVAIASNDFHLFRAKLIAKRLDLDPTGIPSKTPLYIIPNHHVREYFAIVKSFLFDK